MSEGQEGYKPPIDSSKVPAKAPSWYEQEMPYEELVGHIDHFVERARARHPENPFSDNDPFDAAEWLGWQLHEKAMSEGDVAGDKEGVFYPLSLAWDALASDRYTAENGEWGKFCKGLIGGYVRQTGRTSLTLPPKSVKLLDAMAEVAGVPRKRGEAIIDLSPFREMRI